MNDELPQDVVLSEVAWMGATVPSSHDWVQLHNITSRTVDLSGWALGAEDGTPSITLAGSIPPAAYFLLERNWKPCWPCRQPNWRNGLANPERQPSNSDVTCVLCGCSSRTTPSAAANLDIES